jgi:hypothetical protein
LGFQFLAEHHVHRVGPGEVGGWCTPALDPLLVVGWVSAFSTELLCEPTLRVEAFGNPFLAAARGCMVARDRVVPTK